MTCRKRQELLGNDYRDEESRSKKYLLCRLMIHSFLFCLLVCFVEIIIRIMRLVNITGSVPNLEPSTLLTITPR